MYSLRHTLYNNKSGRWYDTETKRVLYFRPINDSLYYFQYNHELGSVGHIVKYDNIYKTPKNGYFVKVVKNGFLLYTKRNTKIGYFTPL